MYGGPESESHIVSCLGVTIRRNRSHLSLSESLSYTGLVLCLVRIITIANTEVKSYPNLNPSPVRNLRSNHYANRESIRSRGPYRLIGIRESLSLSGIALCPSRLSPGHSVQNARSVISYLSLVRSRVYGVQGVLSRSESESPVTNTSLVAVTIRYGIRHYLYLSLSPLSYTSPVTCPSEGTGVAIAWGPSFVICPCRLSVRIGCESLSLQVRLSTGCKSPVRVQVGIAIRLDRVVCMQFCHYAI